MGIEQTMLNGAVSGIEGFVTAIDNLVHEILEIKSKNTERLIRDINVLKAMQTMPLSEKYDAIVKECKENLSEEDFKKIKPSLDKLEESEKSVADGLFEIRRIVSKSGLSHNDKERLLKTLDHAEQSFLDPYIMTVSSGAYNAVMQGIRDHGLIGQVTVGILASGKYMICYDSSIKDQMDDILLEKAYCLGDLTRPGVEDVIASAYAGAGVKSESSILKFSGLTPEMAEKAVEEGDKQGVVTFAKYKDGDTYSIICNAGESKKQKDEIYKKACEILMRSAYMLTGKTGEIEQKRMRHMATEYDKIDKVLSAIDNDHPDPEDIGYVFSIHTVDGKIIPTDYVHFDNEKFTSFRDNIADKTWQASQSNNYKKILEHRIKAGTGQKVYISEPEMTEIKNTAQEALKLVESLPDNKLDALASLSDEMVSIQDDIHEAKVNKNPVLEQAARHQRDVVSIAFDAISMNKTQTKDVSKDLMEARSIANTLESHRFKLIVPEQDKDQVEAEKRLISFCIHDMKVNGEFDFHNDIGISKAGKIREVQMDNIMQKIEKIDIAKFIENEQEKIATKDENAISPEEVAAEQKILEQTVHQHKEEAKDLIEKVFAQMEEAGPSAPEFETKYSEMARYSAWKLRQKYMDNNKEDNLFNNREKTEEKDLGKDLERERDV